MKTKKKSKIWKILKIIWMIIGILILLWTFFFFTQLPKSGNLGELMIFTVLFAAGIYAIAIFIGITILIFLIKLLIKVITKLRKKKGKKKRKKWKLKIFNYSL